MRAETIFLVALIASCRGDTTAPARSAPTIDVIGVDPGPHNVLSATVRASLRGADSAAVVLRSADADGDVRTTPALDLHATATASGDPAVAAVATLPVLGLEAGRRYALQVVAWGRGGAVVSTMIEFASDTLPSDLPRFAAGGLDPSPGYVVLAAGLYGLVLDNAGRVVWYRRFTNGPGLNFTAQPTGRYYARPPTADPSDIEPWHEMDPLGNVTREIRCAHGLRARFHDLIAGPDGDVWLLCDEARTVDLSAFGGVGSARVTGTSVQHVSSTGGLLFQWTPFDHFAITDLPAGERNGVSVNWTHGNALALDVDGRLLVSFRNLSEITKIDVSTGSVVWRLGGLRNEFEFTGTAVPAFTRQHGLRVAGSGSIVLLDNSGDPTESRAETYEIDASARVARLVRSIGSVPGVVTRFGGSVQELPGGRILVSYGTEGRVEEYDVEGRVVWQMSGNAGYVFRAQRIRSLYSPGAGSAR